MFRTIALLAATSLAATPVLAQDSRTASFQGIGGSVTVTAAPKGVLVHVEASGLTPGWHAIHFHGVATCGDAGFKASGGHVHEASVTAPVHGLLNPAASDEGDLPNIYAGADGRAMADLFTTLVTMPKLLDADGSAIIIHAMKDDYMSQPIGGAGDRIGCAALR